MDLRIPPSYLAHARRMLRNSRNHSSKSCPYRQVPVDDGSAPIDVVVDCLMPRHAEIVKNNPTLPFYLVERFAHAIFATVVSQRDLWLGRKDSATVEEIRAARAHACVGSDAHETAKVCCGRFVACGENVAKKSHFRVDPWEQFTNFDNLGERSRMI